MLTPPLSLSALRKLRKLCDKASPGPWHTDDGNIFSSPLSDERERAIMVRVDGDKSAPHPDDGWGDGSDPMGFVASTGQSQPNFENDEAFIGASRAALPALIAEVIAARKVLAHCPRTSEQASDEELVRAARAYDVAVQGGG